MNSTMASTLHARSRGAAFALVAVLALLCPAGLAAQGEAPPPPEPPPTPRIEDAPAADPAVEWEFHDATGLLRPDPRCNSIEPGKDWVIRLKDGTMMAVRLIDILLPAGPDPASLNAFDPRRMEVRWPGGTGSVRRYDTAPAVTVLKPASVPAPPSKTPASASTAWTAARSRPGACPNGHAARSRSSASPRPGRTSGWPRWWMASPSTRGWHG